MFFLGRRVWALALAEAFLVAGCAVLQPSPEAPRPAYEQLQRTEVYRVGTVVSWTPEGVQVQLAPPERLVIQEKGLAGEVVQEILDRLGLLPISIVRVYMEGEAIPGGDRPKVDITDKVKVVSSDRDRLILSVASDLRLSPGQRFFFKSGKVRVAPVDLMARGKGPAGGSEAILEDLTTLLVNTDQFTILERAKIKAILEEHRLALQDFIDPKTAPRAGRLLGAEAILTGTILEAEGKSVANIRVVNVERGEVILAVRKEFQPVEPAPKVVRVIPENGATNVPSTLKEVVIVFDHPMNPGWNVICQPRLTIEGKAGGRAVYWRDDRTFVIPQPNGLAPNQQYACAINTWVGTPLLTPGAGFRGLGQQQFVQPNHFFFTTGP